MPAASTAMQAASTEGAAAAPDRRDALASLLVAVALSGLFVAVRREPRVDGPAHAETPAP